MNARSRLFGVRKAVLWAAATAVIAGAALFSFDMIRLSFAAAREYLETAADPMGQKAARLELEAEIGLRDQEIAFLKEALDLDKSRGNSILKATSTRSTLARVLGTSPGYLRHTLILDQGETEGIEPGMVVFLPPNRYVGRIEEVRERVSFARTIVHPDARLFGRAKETNALGIAEGKFGTGAVFSGLTETGVPKASEEVVSVGGGVREGMVLGTVAETFHKADVSKFEARLIPAFKGLPQFVFLLRP